MHGVRTLALQYRRGRASAPPSASRALAAAGRIDAGPGRDLVDALHCLMGLKLASNLRQIAAGRAPDNSIRLSEIGTLDAPGTEGLARDRAPLPAVAGAALPARRDVTGRRRPRTQVLVALCAAGFALFNFPLAQRLGQGTPTVFGLPLLPTAIFADLDRPDRGPRARERRPARARERRAMISPALVLGASFGYLLLLFTIAAFGDRRAAQGRSVIDNAGIYALSWGVYCTAWTYFGSVGRAASSGVWFLPIYLGPTLAMLLGWVVLRKMVRIASTYRITSIADFIASRYGKSPLLAALVTLITVVGIVPYIALQLKAVSAGYQLLTANPAARRRRRLVARRHPLRRAGARRLRHHLRHAPPRPRRTARGHGRGHRLRVGGQARGLPRGRALRHLGPLRRHGATSGPRASRCRTSRRSSASTGPAPSTTRSGSR